MTALVIALQMELRRILYPVFIHTFLEIVERGAPGEAAQLMNRYKRQLAENSAFPSTMRKQVLQTNLLSITLHRQSLHPRHQARVLASSMHVMGCTDTSNPIGPSSIPYAYESRR